MHINFDIYYFIEKFNLKELSNINRTISVIYRNYKSNKYLDDLLKTKAFCKKRGFKIYLSNNIKLAIKLKLDGVYLPSFNKKLKYCNAPVKKNFKIIGSAHNINEIKIKEKQNCESVFLSPLFKTSKSKNFLGVVRFNLISKDTNKSFICLGGITYKNLNRIKLTKSKGIASVSWIKKNGLNKNLGRF